MGKGKKALGLYWLQALIFTDLVNAVEGDSSSELWHKRLSHISEKRLNCLTKRNLLSRLKGARLDMCTHCLAGKQKRISFKHYFSFREYDLLELVHSDVCGPLKDKSFGGALYFMIFIDDHSKRLWIRTLKSKDQVFGTFKEF